MSRVEAVHLAHVPAGIAVYAALFTEVRNAAFLRQQLLAGNSDFEYAFIDARSVLSTTHILAAVFRAVNDALAGRLRTRNVHSEVVFSLSANNNIAESFRRFGVIDTTTSLLAIKIGGIGTTSDAGPHNGEPLTLESVGDHLTTNVQGKLVPFDDAQIARLTDLDAVCKVYKLRGGANGANGTEGRKDGTANSAGTSAATNGRSMVNATSAQQLDYDANERRKIEIAALGMMALRGS